MKKILIIIIVLAVLIAGYFLFISGMIKNQAVEPEGEIKTLEGAVTAVDLSGMAADGPAIIIIEAETAGTQTIAVPSMGLPLCPARDSIADVSEIAVGDRVSVRGTMNTEREIVPCESADDYLEVTGVERNTTFGYEFSYEKGADGYVLRDAVGGDDPDFVSGISLFNSRDVAELENSTEPREVPPAMHLRVYKNTENHSAADWAAEKTSESNIEQALEEPEEVVVGDAPAVRYTVDGLYMADTYVVARGQYIFVLTGESLDPNDPIVTDYRSLVSSFNFFAPPVQVKG